jgi:GT2 family glycosyltransferase
MSGARPQPYASVIIPTYNGANKIGRCLEALRQQDCTQRFEVIVVSDGSTDGTLEILRRFPEARVIKQANAGPAEARNRGAREAAGKILVFTDDDCEPFPNWLTKMLEPFADPEVVGTKGIYRTRQREIAARFVQIEYEDRYRLMCREPKIDFIDTYSAAFRRARFLEIGGYDSAFPVACAEDVELSYRMSSKGWKMVFTPSAIVYHLHPPTLAAYFKRKFKFAFWRVMAVRNTPSKAIKDSHTPQLMKIQLLLVPSVVAAALVDPPGMTTSSLTGVIALAFALTTVPFTVRAFAQDPVIGIASPLILAGRSCAQFLGVVCGAGYSVVGSIASAFRSPPERKL